MAYLCKRSIKRNWLPKVDTKPTKTKKTVVLKEAKKVVKPVDRKGFNKNIALIFTFIVLVFAAIFGLPPLFGKLEPTATVTNTVDLKTFTPIPASKTKTPTAIAPLLPEFTPAVSPSPIASSKGSGKMAFVSNRDGNDEIYVMNSDGSDQTRLTQNPGRDFFPKWSPDGTKISFLSERGEGNGLYIMNIDGSNQKLLTSSTSEKIGLGDFSWLSWSPDGKKIVFVNYASNKGSDLSIISVDELNQFKLTDTPNIDEFTPSWSPNGLKIAFFREQGLFVIDSDGSNEVEIAKNTSWRNSLSWSPDGSKIAFWGSGSLLYDEIFIADLKSSDMTQLTENNNKDMYPVWSPDGTKIAFVSSRYQGLNEIFIMKPDGNNVQKISNITDRLEYLSDLLWSSDNSKIIFVQNNFLGGFPPEIFRVDINAGDIITLSNNYSSSDYSPDLFLK